MATSAAVAAGSGALDLVDFRLFERRPDGSVYEGIYGISVLRVREILVLPQLSRVPETHAAVEGIFNLRGSQVPAISLATWLRLDAAPPEGTVSKVIVCELGDQNLGLIVHQTSRIRSVPWQEVKPPPPLIARKHGASIHGTTQIDDGRTLLLIDVEQIVAELYADESAAAPEPPPADGPLALVVDDSATSRRQVRRVLTEAGYRVVEAGNGREALEVLSAGDADTGEVTLVVSDVEMPLMDGCALVRAIRAEPRLAGLRVVLNTSLSGANHERAGREAGCDDYVVKFDDDRLRRAVRNLRR